MSAKTTPLFAEKLLVLAKVKEVTETAFPLQSIAEAESDWPIWP